MAHVTAAKVTAKQGSNHKGKRRGIKKYAGEKVRVGGILVRQLGTKVHPGKNVAVAKDYTLFATMDGVVKYTNGTGYNRGKKVVHVLPVTSVAKVTETAKKATKAKAAK